MHTKLKALLALLATAAASGSALAHTGVDVHQHMGFMAGFLHPFAGLDHMAVMLAIGLWSALIAKQFGREMLWGPLGFANVLLAGAALGLQGMQIPAVEPMIAASLVAAGLLVVSKLPLRGVAAAMLAGVFALFHGLAHGYELANNANAFQALAGMVSATLLLHTMGLALGWSLRGANVWVPRMLGGAVAALGSALLFLQLTN
ncbi:urease accessory protein UreJ [Rhodoferax lacus]|uniref:Urease accessory protein UreJ n=1 Tax=Rhodoferax lacus TaxID=2184758 RepID=A0A3E1RE46_9BURK|nr:HupE/UreJ family protein [Rhodoferax lacus]RFO97639.1 urease accessory protein UreJ [Rhodoferax lacus]